mmetsp:Transcript_15453/g.39109  ORF Transcript_15453/g.39109 Transcript_15453/m.39109 type:complete len:95 (-) Transcript_15453:126-410(-)
MSVSDKMNGCNTTFDAIVDAPLMMFFKGPGGTRIHEVNPRRKRGVRALRERYLSGWVCDAIGEAQSIYTKGSVRIRKKRRKENDMLYCPPYSPW